MVGKCSIDALNVFEVDTVHLSWILDIYENSKWNLKAIGIQRCLQERSDLGPHCFVL